MGGTQERNGFSTLGYPPDMRLEADIRRTQSLFDQKPSKAVYNKDQCAVTLT